MFFNKTLLRTLPKLLVSYLKCIFVFLKNEARSLVWGSKWFAHLPIPKFKKKKKTRIPCTVGGGGEGGRRGPGILLPTFDAESKSTKISNSLYGGGWQRSSSRQVQKFLNLSPNLKFLFGGGGGQFPTFDAESEGILAKKVPGMSFGFLLPSGSRILRVREPQKIDT